MIRRLSSVRANMECYEQKTSERYNSFRSESTFLRCISLLEQPNQGAIWLDDQEIKLRPGKHGMLRAENQRALQQLRTKVAMVFQSFNLWSHLTALQNIIEAPVHVKKVPKPEAMAKARANLAKVGRSSEVETKYPSQLSAGHSNALPSLELLRWIRR